MVESNFNALDINFVDEWDDQEEQATPQLDEAFMTSPLTLFMFYLI